MVKFGQLLKGKKDDDDGRGIAMATGHTILADLSLNFVIVPMPMPVPPLNQKRGRKIFL